MIDSKLQAIAYVARREMEAFSRRDDLHSNNDSDLACLCGVSSWFLMQLARYFKYDVRLAVGTFVNEGHCWNVYSNRAIIDITATQFGEEDKVLIRSIEGGKYTYKCGPYELGEWYNGIDTFQEWPSDQNPHVFEEELDPYLDRAITSLTENVVVTDFADRFVVMENPYDRSRASISI